MVSPSSKQMVWWSRSKTVKIRPAGFIDTTYGMSRTAQTIYKRERWSCRYQHMWILKIQCQKFHLGCALPLEMSILAHREFPKSSIDRFKQFKTIVVHCQMLKTGIQMIKDDALVNQWLVFPVHQSEGLSRPLAQIDPHDQVCSEISESLKQSAETHNGTAVRPIVSRIFNCHRMDSNFKFPTIAAFSCTQTAFHISNRNLVRGAVIACVTSSRCRPRFSIEMKWVISVSSARRWLD